MGHPTFRAWLSERVGDGPDRVSRSELGRRLAALAPGGGNADSYRKTVRRILSGTSNPTNATRAAIQAALGDRTAPSREKEAEDKSLSEEELDGLGDLDELLLLTARLSRQVRRTLAKAGQL